MAEEKYIMAIDQGTTSSRAIILMQAGWNIMPMKFGILFNPLLQVL